MSDGYAAVCADRTHVLANVSPPGIVFADDALIALPSYGTFVAARSGPFGHLAIVKDHDTGHALLVNRQTRTVTHLGPTYGNNCVGLQVDGTPVWTDQDGDHFHIGSQTIPVPPGHYSGAGFWLDSAGQPVWYNDQFVHPVSYNGVPFAAASNPDGGDWAFGQSRTTLDYLAYQFSTNTVSVAGPTLDSPIAPNGITLADGSAILARSLPAAWFASSTFGPYPPVPVPPDPPVPPIPPDPPVVPFIERGRALPHYA